MFDRVYIKETAKNRMSGLMGNAILVGLIALLLGGCSNSFSFSFSTRELFNLNHVIVIMMIVGGCIALAFHILVSYAVEVGLNGWFLRYWRGEYPPVGELFASFRIYAPSLTTILLRNVYTALWSLLLIVPGIIKSYAYSMSGYIIFENPNLSASQALDISSRMTYGYKAELFVFDLSYLGWGLLSGFTCGILSIVYVSPYKFTAHAGIYETLKANALRSGTVRYEEFGLVPPSPNGNV